MHPPRIILSRSQDARAVFGNLPTSTFYEWIDKGLMTPGVALGARSVAWPSYELEAIAAARIAGKSDDEIKALVKRLIAARENTAADLASKSDEEIAALVKRFVPGLATPGQEGGAV